jgi:hypothetical protein
MRLLSYKHMHVFTLVLFCLSEPLVCSRQIEVCAQMKLTLFTCIYLQPLGAFKKALEMRFNSVSTLHSYYSCA